MPFAEVEELRTVVAEGRERGYLTPEEIAAPLEDVEPSREQVVDLHQYLIENGIEIVSEEEARANGAGRAGAARGDRGSEEGRARPDRRAVARLAAPVPAFDRPRRPADRRAGGDARQAHRARRHGREAADDRGEPAPRRLDREELPGPRAHVPGPDPGGLARADPRGGEVRLPPRLQVLDVRDVVDPPSRHARDRRQGTDDPHSRSTWCSNSARTGGCSPSSWTN